MPPVLEHRSAVIVPFTPRSPRLTMLDRIDALDWSLVEAPAMNVRLLIHERDPYDAPEVGDYVAIYRRLERWALWSAARRGRHAVTVWHGPSGVDLGAFITMRDALAAVSRAFIKQRGQA